jgi:poly(A) polymerase
MMRAVRFSAQLGFEIDTVLLEVLRSGAAMLEDISWERRREELEKILVSESPASGLRTLVKTGLMEHVSPEIAAMEGVEQPPSYHRADVLEHTLLTVGCVSPDPLLRRAALFHDAGKPPARVTEPKTMFPDHDRIGVELTTQAMRRLRYGNEDIRKTVFIVRMHMRPIHYRSDWSDAAVRRLVRDCTLMKDCEVAVPLEVVLAVARADILAGNEEKATVFLGLVDELEGRIEALRAEQAIESIRSPLDGRELMAIFDLGPGPWIEDVKEHLVQLMLEGELSPDDKEKAANRARIFLNEITSPL